MKLWRYTYAEREDIRIDWWVRRRAYILCSECSPVLVTIRRGHGTKSKRVVNGGLIDWLIDDSGVGDSSRHQLRGGKRWTEQLNSTEFNWSCAIMDRSTEIGSGHILRLYNSTTLHQYSLRLLLHDCCSFGLRAHLTTAVTIRDRDGF